MLYTNEAIKKRQKKHKKIKNFSSIIVYIIVIPLLIYNISLIIQSVLDPHKTPSFFGIKSYVIISGSMEPELEIGDIVVAKETKEELKKGDIICFREGQNIITHRIIEVIKNDKDTEYKTKGDNNNAEDSGTITEKSIEGKVVKRIPFIGKISLILQNRVVIVLIILAIYFYFMYSNISKRKKSERKLKRIRYENAEIDRKKSL